MRHDPLFTTHCISSNRTSYLNNESTTLVTLPLGSLFVELTFSVFPRVSKLWCPKSQSIETYDHVKKGCYTRLDPSGSSLLSNFVQCFHTYFFCSKFLKAYEPYFSLYRLPFLSFSSHSLYVSLTHLSSDLRQCVTGVPVPSLECPLYVCQSRGPGTT